MGLAAHFRHVVATDASAEQIARARLHPSVEYGVAPAAASGLPDRSADAVTVAQALHWLDLPSFYAEARRVLRVDGTLFVWSYGDPQLDDARLNEIVSGYNLGTLAGYWPPERAGVGHGLLSLPFPFVEATMSTSTMRAKWTRESLVGYLRSWSATALFVAKTGHDPLVELDRQLAARWGPAETRRVVSWPLVVRAGRPSQ
ncbi:MAG: class I SAM-dependent methyltransferase [Gemmatimonadaceae bacterium]